MLRVADFHDAPTAAPPRRSSQHPLSGLPPSERPPRPPSPFFRGVDSANISISEMIEATLDKQRDKVGGECGRRNEGVGEREGAPQRK